MLSLHSKDLEAYDSANQLIREDNQAAGKSWVWTYDDAGNILSKREYAYTTGTLGTAQSTIYYSYGNAEWGDLLTTYNSTPITYHTIGNPLSDGTWNYTWIHGRKLVTMYKNGTTCSFSYDANGMRNRRTVITSNGTTTYNYTYSGSQLTHMTVGGYTLHFYYDANGYPMSVVYNGTTYYYATNLQGDVVAILNSSGVQVVGYRYDAWGRLLTTTGSMSGSLGYHNPLRYRGYVYDSETQLYYLQSRYYNPAMGRFINADGLVSTGQGILSSNMFAYCNNNPVNLTDHSGTIPFADDPFTEMYQQIGSWLSPYVAVFFSKFWTSFSGSCSISGEVGSGVGFSGKIGVVSTEAEFILVADEWTLNSDGTSEAVRKGSIAVQGELTDNISVGVDVQYKVPLEAGKEYGLLGAPGGKFDVVIGAYAFDQGIGWNTLSPRDFSLSFGFSGYFVLGGGFEFSINLSRFVEIWQTC